MGAAALLCGVALAQPAAARSAKTYNHNPCHAKNTWPGCVRKHHSLDLRPYTPRKYKDHGLEDAMSELGRTARGYWATPYFVYRVGAERMARALKKNHLNAVVIDTKSDFGRVLYPSKVPLSRKQQKHLLRDPRKLIETLHRHGIYVIARLVCFKDSRLPFIRPDLSARIGRRARRLLSAGANWLDPYSMEVQDYIIDLVQATRAMESLHVGASPRGTLTLIKCGQALATIRGRDYVGPDEIKELAVPALAHRVLLAPEARMGDVTAEQIIGDLLDTVSVPV